MPAARAGAACVVVLGPQAAMPEPAPPNAFVARYLPFERLLPRATLSVSHAGAGSLLLALAHGLPQLLLPYGADQFRNADALAACGAARTIEGEPSPQALREAIEALLDHPTIPTAARALRAEIDALPGPDQSVAAIEALPPRS
jgi:UDP:flavonoid glycosyltransferase YjiC (YdhE family)